MKPSRSFLSPGLDLPPQMARSQRRDRPWELGEGGGGSKGEVLEGGCGHHCVRG